MVDEPLMHKTPRTEFETLVWERHMNKELCKQISEQKIENGILQSELAEIKADRNALLEFYKKEDKGRVVAKNRELKINIHKKDLKIKDLKRRNDDLMQGFIRLQKKEVSGLLKQDVDDRTA